MDSKAFFQACQDGDVEKLLECFEAIGELDISGKDGYGMTALAYAARNGHVEVVRQLLLKGADRTEVLEQGYGRSNAEIARLLEEGPSGSAQTEVQAADDAVNQQGNSMQEGTFINEAMYPPQGYPIIPAFGVPQQYYYDGMHPNSAPAGSNGRIPRQHGHSRTESNTGLPPPEVARSIPCRYFPNCRYGDKCMFAHPIMAAPPGSAPISPSMSPPHMQPMFYQQMQAGYPYPGPYGQPQFYSSMGPMQPAYGMVAPFNQPMVHSQQSQEEANAVQQASEQVNESAVPESQEQSQTTSSLQSAAQTAEDENSKERDATGTPPQQDGAAPSASPKEGQQFETNGSNGDETAQDGKPVHRRQSFNSFMHHHAVPFQPNGLHPVVDMGMMNTMQPFMPRSGPKGRRAPGMNGTGKRSNAERPACVFFAGRGCRIGDECRFPHILPDGTDARPIQAQQRQMYASAYGAVNPAMQVPVDASSDVATSATPTGPQADKKSIEQPKGQPDNQQSSQPMQGKSTSQSSSGNSAPAAIVPSIPSKTSTGTSPSTSRGSHNKKQQNNHQQQSQQQQHQPSRPAQRIPTVNDFPALAAPSPNIPTPSSPSTSATAALSNPSTATNGDISSPATTNGPAPTANGKRINFSAILSAPAPPKAKAPVDAASIKTSNGDENGHKEEDKSIETSAKPNGTSKDSKARSKEAKAPTHVKVDSYKSAVTAPSKAPLQDEDDFQVVHRSRTSNSNQVKAVAA